MRTLSTDQMVEEIKSKRERAFYAESTLAQLQAPNPMIMASWGAHKFSKIKHEEYPDEAGALIFKVQGRKFLGCVAIVLGWADLYNVYFYEADKKTRTFTERTDYQLSDVYADDLTNFIDEVVETDKMQAV